MDNIRVRIILLYMSDEGFQQFGFSAAPETCDHLDVRRAFHLVQFVKIEFPFDQFQIQSPPAKIATCYSAKSRIIQKCEIGIRIFLLFLPNVISSEILLLSCIPQQKSHI